MKKIIEFFVHRNIFGNLVTVGILLAGIVALFSMRREAFPKVDFDIVNVLAVYPGASPQEVEKLLTIPIEREARGVDGIKRVDSSSLESRAAVTFTLEPSVKDKEKVIQNIKDAVDRAKVDFPADAEEPQVIEISTERTPIIEIALASKSGDAKGLSEKDVRALAKRLAEKIELLNGTASVDKRGYRDREIHVQVDPEKMAIYNISTDEIINAIRTRNVNFPGGTVTEKGKEYQIRTVKEYEEADEIRSLIVRANDLGNAVTVGDVAYVSDTFKKKTIMEKASGNESTVLTVLKKEKADAIRLVDEVFKSIKDFKKTAPADLNIATFNDMSFYIRRRLNVLSGNVGIGMVLVVVSLFFFLGWRVSLMVAIGIPFSFAVTFLVMQKLDISINLISMFGLIIVSGMLVDDAIVVGENFYRHLEKGSHPVRAAILGAQEMVVPVLGSVTTTMVAFAPLMLMGGIMGKFVWYIPAAVIIALAASMFECFTILPAHLADITKGVKASDIVKGKESFEHRIFAALQRIYHPVLEWALHYKYLVLVLTFFGFIGGVLLIPAIGFELFPKDGIEIFFIKTEGPQGASLDDMNERIKPLEKAVSQLPAMELDTFTTRVGIHQEQPNDPFTKRGKNYAQIAVFLTPENKRKRKASEIIGYLQRKLNMTHPWYLAQVMRDGNSEKLLRISNFREALVYGNDFGKPERKMDFSKEYLLGGGFINGGKGLAAYAGNNMIYIADFQSGKLKQEIPVKLRTFDAPQSFHVIPGGQGGVVFTDLLYMKYIDLTDGSAKNLTRLSNSVTSVSFSPDGKTMAVSTDKGAVDIWDVSGKPKLVRSVTESWAIDTDFKNNTRAFNEKRNNALGRVENASFGPDGSNILLACFDGTLRRIRVADGKTIKAWMISEQPILWATTATDDLIWVSQLDKLFIFDAVNHVKKEEISILGTIQKHIIFNGEILGLGDYDSVIRLGTIAAATGKAEKSSGRPERIAGPLKVLANGERTLEKTEFKQAGGGPPVGAPVQIEVRGDDFPPLLEVAKIVKDKLFALEGVYDIRDNWELGKEEFHVEIDERTAARAGVSVMQIAATLQAAFEGNVSTSIKKADEEIDIRVIFPEHLREKLSSLNKVKVRNMVGNLVPITALASFKKYPGVSIITHSNNRRTIYVKANIDTRKSSSVEINRKIMQVMTPIMKKHVGVDLYAGGEYEDTQESMRDLLFAGLVAILGIGGILVLIFGNLRNPRVVMAAIPLGLVGVTLSFFVHKIIAQPNLVFSFLASMGIVGLAGVVVNDSIVLVDFINNLRKSGLNMHDAIVNGGLSRLRAVLLTTVTTVAGLLPTAYGIGGDDPFLRPMALAMGWGLAFATLITLIVIPVYYAVWEDRGYIFHHVVSRKLARIGKED